MTNSKTTKRALLSSAFAVLMCFAMLIGTTFAWFTDEAQASVNRIQSGTLDVDIVDKEGNSLEGRTLSFKNADGSADILWEPGCRYSLEQFKVVNKGNLALKYSIQITGISGSAKLNEVIDWTFEGLAGGTGELLPQAASELITITGVMDENADNDYQNLTIDGIAITVFATQLSSEKDSIDETYDAAAPLTSYWDGESSVMPEEADGVYTVKTAAEFVGIMNYSQNINSSFLGKTIVLENNIDFGGRAVKGVGSHQGNFAGTFDGKGHTVSNFKIDNNREWYAGLFNQVSHGGNIKDLKVENATVIGGRMTGVIASNLDSGAIDNCHVKNCTVVATVKKAGSITGYTSYGTVTNCTATDVDVYCADSNTAESGKLVGYVNEGSVVDAVTSANAVRVNVYPGRTLQTAATETELNNALANGGLVSVSGNIENVSPSQLVSSDVKTSLELNGNTLTIDNDSGSDSKAIAGDKQLVIKGGKVDGDYISVRPGNSTEGAITFEDVRFDRTTVRPTYGPCSDLVGEALKWYAQGGKTVLVFKNCTFTNASILLSCASGYTSEIEATFENCTFNNIGITAPITASGSVSGRITVKDCKFNLTATGSVSAVEANGAADVTWSFEGANTVNGIAATVADGYKVNSPAVKAFNSTANVAGADTITVKGIAVK